MELKEIKQLEGYGVCFKRLTEDKIELVRRWRNDPKISRYMEYREEISPEAQLKWFHRIDNESNYYFLIVMEGKEIGLINIRDVDFARKTGEPGIFIWDDEYLNSDISFRSNLLLTDFAFDTLHLEELVIHVLSDNKRAIQYNKCFGYKLSEGQQDVYNQEYTLDLERYLRSKERILKYL